MQYEVEDNLSQLDADIRLNEREVVSIEREIDKSWNQRSLDYGYIFGLEEKVKGKKEVVIRLKQFRTERF